MQVLMFALILILYSSEYSLVLTCLTCLILLELLPNFTSELHLKNNLK